MQSSPTLDSPTMSIEIDMLKLMNEASTSLDLGKYKISFELYIKALLLAVEEFQQVQFKNQCIDAQQHDLSNVFLLAETCLKHTKVITLKKKLTSPPTVPPKPSTLTISTKKQPPPLPTRPTALSMSRTRSDSVQKCNTDYATTITSYSDDDIDEIEENENVAVPALKKDQYHVNKPQRKASIIRRKGNKIKRRSSTSNINSSIPSSPLTTGNPLNAVKSFLSLPSAMASHTVLEGDDIFLLSSSTIDPNILITVQTSHSDNSLQSTTTSNNNYLPMIPQAPLVTVYQSLQKKLEEVKKTDEQFNEIQVLLNRVRNIHMSATTVPTILQFQPVLIAYQLTLIESAIFRNISTDAILSHSPKTPHPTIVASTDFFNYLTRIIEHAILLQQDASGRAQHINHWIKVAGKCHELKNYQTLKAVISALGTPPIQRLKRSWSFIPKKSMNLLEDLSELMSEASNYGKYRTRLGLQEQQQNDEPTSTRKASIAMTSAGLPAVSNNTSTNTTTHTSKTSTNRKNSFSEPTVPFLGIFIHDMTYLIAALSKKKYDHNSQWISKNNHDNTEILIEKLQRDARVSEVLKLFKNLQRSPPYSPNLSAGCVKDMNKNRKRKLSHALTRTSAIKKTPAYFANQHDDETGGELSIEMQQCLVTQYLLTRSWVSEKTVDELSLVREPTKRSFSVTDSLASAPAFTSCSSTTLPAPPPITSSVSLTTTTRSSSGSLTSSSSNSRPLSLDDDADDEIIERKGSIGGGGGFWLFGRKSVDQGHHKSSNEQFGTLTRSPKHFSFEDLHNNAAATTRGNSMKKQQSSLSIDSNTVKMQREGSQSSLASSIFKKDFWKNSNANNANAPSGRNPLLNFHSDPSMITSITVQRKSSTNSLIHPSPSTSSETHHYQQQQQHHNLRKQLHTTSPHPLDNLSSTASTPQSEFADFQWNQ